MAVGENRIRVQGNDGKFYWYNAKTGRLFQTRTGTQEVKLRFTFANGMVFFGPGPTDTPNQPPRGPQASPGHPTNPNQDPRDPSQPAPGPRDPDEPPREEDPNDPCPPGWHMDWASGTCVQDEEDDDDEEEEPDEYTREEARADIIDAISDSLGLIFTPQEIEEIVNAIIEPVLMGELSDNDIIRLIRNTEVHKAKFPGFLDRISNGHAGMSEYEYLQMRDDANEVFQSYKGATLGKDFFGQMWAGDQSVKELEHRLQIGKLIEDHGGAIQEFFETEAGVSLTDEDLYEYLSDNISTPVFDRLYEDAFYKRYLWNIGVKREVTDDMVKDLRGRGVSVEQAIQRYQQLGQSMPGIDRLAAIDDSIAGDQAHSLNSFSHAFRAFGLLDPDSQLQIAQAFARETARFSQGGGTAFAGTRAIGLQSRFERV